MNSIWKKISTLACAGVLLAGTCVFSGCADSAYDVAVKYGGFVGTEEEWLQSLKGENGKDAEDIDIYDIYEAENAKSPISWEDFLKKYLTLNVNETGDTQTLAKCTSSIVSVYCGFSKKEIGNQGFAVAVDASAGSGVIVDLNKEAGNAYIITNYHVLYNAEFDMISNHTYLYLYGARNHFSLLDSKGKRIIENGVPYETSDGYLDDGYTEDQIGDQDGDGIKATYVGGAMDYDIAILKVEGSEYLRNSAATEATIGNSEEVTLGEKAYAIGNANALGISTTSGVISVESEYITMTATDGRDADNDGVKDEVRYRVMRTDALINHGNSGGGLFNSKGELIGITNAKNVEEETEGIGYALPITVVKNVMQNILDNGDKKLHRAMLGVTTYINESVASLDENGKIKITETIIVTEKPESGYSAYGKLKVNDIIKSVTIGGKTTEITRNYQMSDLLLTVRKGDTISITVLRNAFGGGQTEVTETVTFDKDEYFKIYG